jgi:hypothetical protein
VRTMLQLRRFACLVRRMTLGVYLLEGESSGVSLRAIVADDGSTLDDIRGIIFPDGAKVTRKGAISAPKAPGLMGSDADLVVVGANHLLGDYYRSRGFYLLPKYVRQRLPVLETPEQTLGRLSTGVQKDIRHKLRRMESMGVKCELIRDPAWLDTFYHEMYKPYTLSRFEEMAAVSRFKDVKRAFQRGGGLALKQNGVSFSASVVFPQGEVMRFPYSGTLSGSEELARKGGKTVLYYNALRLAHEWGCSAIDLGHTGPFLSDGVLQFKLKWGSQVLDDDDGTGYFAIAAPGRTEAARRFLAANRFYHVTDGEMSVGVE